MSPTYRLGAATALVMVVIAAFSWGLGAGQPEALAEVQHGAGFKATVLGWQSWYGSYGLGDLGWGWCIDHGSRAPDAEFRYVPTDVADKSADTRAAVSWAVTTNAIHDATVGSAVMLAVHDLMGAIYPHGRLDVDVLGTDQLSGFAGNEGSVIAKARKIKADALAHAHLRGPFRLLLETEGVAAGQRGRLFVGLRDTNGAGVRGVPVWLSAFGVSLDPAPAATDDRGNMVVGFTAGPAGGRFAAMASIPDSTLSAYAPTTTRAQRIARPSGSRVDAQTDFAPTTTTTLPPATTTSTVPATTTSTIPATTTTATVPPTVPATSPPSTTPPRTDKTIPPRTTSTTRPDTTTSSNPGPSQPELPPMNPSQPPTSPLPPTTARGTLPITGASARGPLFTGSGLVLLGASLVAFVREHRRRGRPAARP